MATSSIFANVVINNEDSAQAIVQAYENFESQGCPRYEAKSKPVLSPEKIKSFFSMEAPTDDN